MTHSVNDTPRRRDAETVLTAQDKGIPERAVGLTIAEFLATRPHLSEFWTPLVVLDDDAMRHNTATMAQWCDERGLELMPHGKTTMAPTLWQRQLDAGSTGITLATMGQVRTARGLGFDSIMLANAAIDARSLRFLANELADDAFQFVCWADSIATIEAMEQSLHRERPPRPVNVCVELGAEGGRTGARTITDAITVAERIAASDVLRLAGVSGYEGSIADGHRAAPTIDRVAAYLRNQVELHQSIGQLYDHGDIIVTAGGSAYFDVVASVYATAGAAPQAQERPGGGRTRFVLRSGAYIVHDDGFYREVSPFDEGAGATDGPRFRPAMHGVARVVSHPERGLSLVDAGKRDIPYDEGLPIPRHAAPDLGAQWASIDGVAVSAMNDQHTYLRSEHETPPVGAVVHLGLSHPCTAFDKWRVLPVVASKDSDIVVDLVRTWF